MSPITTLKQGERLINYNPSKALSTYMYLFMESTLKLFTVIFKWGNQRHTTYFKKPNLRQQFQPLLFLPSPNYSSLWVWLAKVARQTGAYSFSSFQSSLQQRCPCRKTVSKEKGHGWKEESEEQVGEPQFEPARPRGRTPAWDMWGARSSSSLPGLNCSVSLTPGTLSSFQLCLVQLSIHFYYASLE